MKSLTVGNGDAMLAVLGMIADKSMIEDNGEHVFRWKRCDGFPICLDRGNNHKAKCDPVGPDDHITLSLVTAPWIEAGHSSEEPIQHSQVPETFEDILDCSLRRGGSSLQTFREFDRRLMEEAEACYMDDTDEFDGGEGNETQADWESDADDVGRQKPQWMLDALRWDGLP
jgi:hypothetical protein